MCLFNLACYSHNHSLFYLIISIILSSLGLEHAFFSSATLRLSNHSSYHTPQSHALTQLCPPQSPCLGCCCISMMLDFSSTHRYCKPRRHDHVHAASNTAARTIGCRFVRLALGNALLRVFVPATTFLAQSRQSLLYFHLLGTAFSSIHCLASASCMISLAGILRVSLRVWSPTLCHAGRSHDLFPIR